MGLEVKDGGGGAGAQGGSGKRASVPARPPILLVACRKAAPAAAHLPTSRSQRLGWCRRAGGDHTPNFVAAFSLARPSLPGPGIRQGGEGAGAQPLWRSMMSGRQARALDGPSSIESGLLTPRIHGTPTRASRSIPLWPAGTRGKAKQSNAGGRRRHSCPWRGSPHACRPLGIRSPRPVPFPGRQRARQASRRLPTWHWHTTTHTPKGRLKANGKAHDAASPSNHEPDARTLLDEQGAPTGESSRILRTIWLLLGVHAKQRRIPSLTSIHFATTRGDCNSNNTGVQYSNSSIRTPKVHA